MPGTLLAYASAADGKWKSTNQRKSSPLNVMPSAAKRVEAPLVCTMNQTEARLRSSCPIADEGKETLYRKDLPGFVCRFVYLLEGIDSEQHGLQFVDFYVRIEYFFEVEIVNLAPALYNVRAFFL